MDVERARARDKLTAERDAQRERERLAEEREQRRQKADLDAAREKAAIENEILLLSLKVLMPKPQRVVKEQLTDKLKRGPSC